MDEKIKDILSRYQEIELLGDFRYGVKFKLFESNYAICMLNEDLFPLILIIDNTCQYPHFSLKEISLDGHNYKSICLFELGVMIEYVYSLEEKVTLCIERLLRLVQLSPSEVVKEYHKEFLGYWNVACASSGQYGQYEYSLFLNDDNQYQWLEQQVFENKKIRITHSSRYFNDSNKRKTVQTARVLFLPIVDSRNLIPPLPTGKWGAKEINDIVHGIKYQRISYEAYDAIKNMEYHKKELLLVFKLNEFFFGCMVKFSNSSKTSLLEKISSEINSVIPLEISRCDHTYLNAQIGNRTSDKKIAIIGAGSLGSYLANELIHAGYKNLLIIDHDRYEYSNTFRHRVDWFTNNVCKSLCVALSLNSIHPEINAQYLDVFLDEGNFEKLLLDQEVEQIIFTVGSSDVQLRMNKKFIQEHLSIPVYYAWLEHDGNTSHVAIINNYKEGCFECLYTDASGKLGENLVNKSDKTTIKYIRNGCGGTRVPYGNKTLLTASAMILKAMNDNKQGNWLYTYHDDQIVTEKFPKNSRCKSCDLC